MKAVLFIVITVELMWLGWSGVFNAHHEQYVVGDMGYFLAMFPGAAVLDYAAIQCLLTLKWGEETFKYVKWLIALFAASVVGHLVGAYGFITDNMVVLGMYDMLGAFILAAEVGVFIVYGMANLSSRHNNYNSSGSKHT